MDLTPIDIAKPDAAPNLPPLVPIRISDLKWSVLPTGDFCLDSRGYETMSRNNAEVLRWVTEAKYRLNYYEEKKP